jgi:hypothetical protein
MYSMDSTNSTATSELETTTNMTSNASHGAAHAVFFTNELLCDIVARLPLQDIVAATGICKFWRTDLKSNPQVQEALFLKPVEVREVMADIDCVRDTANPIAIDKCRVIGAIHPSIDKICGKTQAGTFGVKLGDLQYFPTFDHAEGSWREMLVTQPPCKSITLRLCEWYSGHSQLFDFKTVEGMTLGQLYDFIHTRFTARDLAMTEGAVYINLYAAEDVSLMFESWTVRCKIRDGHVCRPEKIPPKRRITHALDNSDDSDVSGSEVSSYYDPGDEYPYDMGWDSDFDEDFDIDDLSDDGY